MKGGTLLRVVRPDHRLQGEGDRVKGAQLIPSDFSNVAKTWCLGGFSPVIKGISQCTYGRTIRNSSISGDTWQLLLGAGSSSHIARRGTSASLRVPAWSLDHYSFT